MGRSRSAVRTPNILRGRERPYEAQNVELRHDGKTAFNTQTGQNYALEPDGSWIDSKTGKCVGTIPLGGTHTEHTPGTGAPYEVPNVELRHDGKTAFNTQTKQNYALEACPPPRTAQQQPTPSTTDKVTDVLKTIGSSVSIGIGGGGYSSGHDEHRHGGEDRHRTADKVSTDKTKTHTTSPTTTHKTVTSACKCHPCTCSPCTCH